MILLTNEPNGTYSRRSQIVGGTTGESTQGIVWVDDFDLRFQTGETTNQSFMQII